jgi:hypothetical protein
MRFFMSFYGSNTQVMGLKGLTYLEQSKDLSMPRGFFHSVSCNLIIYVTQVTGLKGLTYLDKSKDPKNPAKGTEQREAVTFGQGLVDSVYLAAPEHVELEVGTGGPRSVTTY